jgi:hypothetical protein
MKILTADPDWAPELYGARALAMTFVRKHGRWQRDAATFLIAERNGLKVTSYLHRSPLMLTIDASGERVEPFARVFKIEWNDGDAWRVAIETYHHGQWQSRLEAIVHPAVARALASVSDFHGLIASAAKRCFEIVIEGFCWNRNSSWALVVCLMSRVPATPVWRETYL